LSKNSAGDELDRDIIRTAKEKKPQTVSELITLIKQKYPVTDRQILRHVESLQEKGEIQVKPAESPPIETLAAYARSMQAAWYWITLTLAAATIATVYTIPAQVYPQAYIRNIVGAIFILLLPGYAFIKALFPRRLPIKTTDKELDTIERIALSLGMSLALVPITGLLLNYTPWGITLTPVTLSLTALTLAFATAGLIREHQTTTSSQATPA
jgi:hypothetical protein